MASPRVVEVSDVWEKIGTLTDKVETMDLKVRTMLGLLDVATKHC